MHVKTAGVLRGKLSCEEGDSEQTDETQPRQLRNGNRGVFFLTRQLVCTRKLITRFVLSLEQASKILRNVEKYECDPTVGCVILKVRNEIKLQVQ